MGVIINLSAAKHMLKKCKVEESASRITSSGSYEQISNFL